MGVTAMEASTNDLVRTNSLFLLRNALPALQPLIVRAALAGSDGLVPLFTAARDLILTIPPLPQPAPPGARATIRVFVESTAPGEYQLVAFRQFTGYPDDEMEVMVPTNLATALITEEYLANNDPVLFRIPPHRDDRRREGPGFHSLLRKHPQPHAVVLCRTARHGAA